MVKSKVIREEFVNKSEKRLQRKIWCKIEHWEKSNWRRITNIWQRIKNEEKRTEMLEKLWTEVMEKGMKAEPKEKGYAHKLTDYEIRPIIGTLSFFQVNDYFQKQAQFDLFICKYRIFDWIATNLDGRMWEYPEETEGQKLRICWLICKFAEIYLNLDGDIHKFAEYLMLWDLQPEFEGRE
ncbi:MAG: hypothetical protein ACTSVO_00715 [Candidatus Heimdallarchaeaceae archaeon]